MKNNRLFGILYLLLSKNKITAKELADYFEVSIRTIYRDIDILSSLSIPIYASKGKNGGIELLEDYKFDKSIFTEEEQKEMLFSLQSLKKVNANDNHLLEKMKTIFSSVEEEEWFEIDFNGWDYSELHQENFNLIKDAILKKRVLEFTYFNSYGETSKRIVEPLKLCFKYNAWYLSAYDRAKEDSRFFKLMRIRNLKLLEDTFERRELPKPKEVSVPMITKITLEIDSSEAYRVYDEFSDASITKLENGKFLVELELPENDWLYGYLLSFGEHIKILKPTRIRNIIKAKLEKSLKNYKD